MKEKAKGTRMDAVHRLEELARQIEQGTIQLGDKRFPVPDDIRVQVKAHRDELEIDLKWRPNTASATDGDGRVEEDEATSPAR